MAPTRIISIIGRKDAGKTTLVVALAAEFNRQGKKVATIKHGHHPAALDTEGTDTWRHYHEGHARRTLIESPGQRVLFERTESDGDPETLAREYMQGMDLVIVEGFSRSTLPKIEVHRSKLHPAPLLDPGAANAHFWVGLVTDDPDLQAPCSIFRFTDTAWMVTLSVIAWGRAKILQP